MAKSRAEKSIGPSAPATVRLLPMQLQVGDRFVDASGAWEVIGRPYTTAGGKVARARVKLMTETAVTEIRLWAAHVRIAVRRA